MDTMDYIKIAEELAEKEENLREYLGKLETELALAQQAHKEAMEERAAAAAYAREQMEKSNQPRLQELYQEKAERMEENREKPLFPAADVDRLHEILTEKGRETAHLYRQILREDLEDVLEGIKKHKTLNTDTRLQYQKIAAAARYIPEAGLDIVNPEEEAALLRLRFAIEDTLENLKD